MPLLCLAAVQDFGAAADAQALCDAATSAPSHDVLITPNNGLHGTALVDPGLNPRAAEIRAQLDAFLAG